MDTNTHIMLRSHSVKDVLRASVARMHVWVLLGDEQADFSHVHQCGPTLHCGCADVRDDAGQRRVLFRGQNDQHADGVAVVGQLNHLIFQSLRRGGHAWQKRRGEG